MTKLIENYHFSPLTSDLVSLLFLHTYFDVSVRGSLQPQYLSKGADHPGVAGEAGEMEKYET